MARNLTQRQAMEAYRRVCRQLGYEPFDKHVVQGGYRPPGFDLDRPLLYRDFESWYSTTRWAVVFEAGEYDWTLSEGVMIAARGNGSVFSEAINGYALGLYPAS